MTLALKKLITYLLTDLTT